MQWPAKEWDDRFRRAAEHYPLRTDSADWSQVEERLRDATPARRRRPKAFLLLGPLLLLSLQTYPPYRFNEYPVETGGRPGEAAQGRTLLRAAPTGQAAIATVQKSTDTGEAPSVAAHRPLRLKPAQIIASPAKALGATAAMDESGKPLATLQQRFPPTDRPAEGATVQIRPAAAPAAIAPEDKHPVPAGARFYLGLMAASDASSVQGQSFSRPGFEAGILVGYSLTPRLSVETGLYWDNKHYASEGSYFNTRRLYLPPNTRITAVAGTCRMFEIPLNLRYRLGANPQQGAYVLAGLSSYLMKEEDYRYDYYYASSNRTVAHDKQYRNETQNWFGVVQLAAGYQWPLGRRNTLRVEPYCKLPLQGLGYGELRFSSLGLRLGLTRAFF